MKDIEQLYALWDEFLKEWPAQRLRTMTLDEYTQAGSKDTFTYWLEWRLRDLGSIRGIWASKFGIFSRANDEPKESHGRLRYCDSHAWYSALGATAEEAFEKVRDYVIQIAELASQGDVDGIGALGFKDSEGRSLRIKEAEGEAFRWKVAFHYQNRQNPVIVNVFKPALLAAYTGRDASEGMAALQKAAIAKRPAGMGILEYGRQIGMTQQQKNGGAAPPPAPCTNLIYYGPPGTGKTHKLNEILEHEYAQTNVSPEEWRNRFIAEKITTLKWWENAVAVLYDLGGEADVTQMTRHPFIQAIAKTKSIQNLRATLWGALQHHAIEGSIVATQNRAAPAVFDKNASSVWKLAGDWEDACADLIALVDEFKRGPQETSVIQRYRFVTFHQSYGYEEFVEGLRPVLNDETAQGEVAYEIRPGVFKQLCDEARQSPGQRFAMVIDEINRGNISKIFGELITLIEADKRDPLNGEKPPIEVVLPYSGEKFSVPANVDIYGTMNTADRSLALLDMALRRRFEFRPLLPDGTLLGKVIFENKEINLCQMLEKMNARIEALYDRDHCIGHAYLMDVKHFDDLKNVFRHRIIALLEEYFFDDWQKIRLVLGDNQKEKAHQFMTESEMDLNALFGENHELENDALKRHYVLQEKAFSEPDAYIGIYQSFSSN